MLTNTNTNLFTFWNDFVHSKNTNVKEVARKEHGKITFATFYTSLLIIIKYGMLGSWTSISNGKL
jgi:hypothetical protein